MPPCFTTDMIFLGLYDNPFFKQKIFPFSILVTTFPHNSSHKTLWNLKFIAYHTTQDTHRKKLCWKVNKIVFLAKFWCLVIWSNSGKWAECEIFNNSSTHVYACRVSPIFGTHLQWAINRSWPNVTLNGMHQILTLTFQIYQKHQNGSFQCDIGNKSMTCLWQQPLNKGTQKGNQILEIS